MDWQEVTEGNRPPQNKHLLWLLAMPQKDGSYQWVLLGSGIYAFGIVAGVVGRFTLPPPGEDEPYLRGKRVFWKEIELPEGIE